MFGNCKIHSISFIDPLGILTTNKFSKNYFHEIFLYHSRSLQILCVKFDVKSEAKEPIENKTEYQQPDCHDNKHFAH